MRTRHILTALALPALFAACTADEFESANMEQGLQERAKLSKDFALITGNGADTRYAAEGEAGITFTYDENDRIGAAIVDQYNTAYPNEPEKWTIIPSLAGNYPFIYKGDYTWQSDYELGIGNYIFVFPYNASDNNRAAVSYELPTIQNLYESEDGPQVLNAAIEAGNKAVAAAVLHEGETVANVDMKNLFTYPKVTIKFDNAEPVTTVSQVVLKSTKGFAVKGGLDHQTVVDMFANNETNLSGKTYWDATDKVVDWDKVDTEDFLIPEGDANAAYGELERESYIIVKFPKNTQVQLDNERNKYVEARFMMPSVEDFSNTNIDMQLYVYTNNGVYVTSFNAAACSFRSTTSEEAKKQALWRSRSNGLTLKNLTASNIQTVENIVTSIDDWNALVDTYGASSRYETTPLKVAVIGDEFTLNASAKMPSVAIFEVSTPVKVEGNVTISNVTVKNTVTVEEGATLTTNGTFVADKVENNGTLVFVPAEDEEGDVVNYGKDVPGISTVENYGTLTINAEGISTFALMNAEGATVTNAGTIYVSEATADVDGKQYIGNNGEIVNNGTMNTTGFRNASRKYAENYKAGDEPTYVPTITNNGNIIAQSGTLTNKALIINNGSMTCQSGQGSIKNDADNQGIAAELRAANAPARTYITDNANGKVVVYVANPTNLTIEGDKGVVEYTTSAASESFANSLVNTVIASKDYTVTGGSLTSLTMTGTAKLSVTGTSTSIGTLEVTEGVVTLGSDLTVTTVKIAEGAEIDVPSNAELTIKGLSIENEGTITVGGTLNAENILRADAGDVQNNGGEINFNPTQEDVDKESFETALEALVVAWVDNSSNSTAWTSATVEEMSKTGWGGNNWTKSYAETLATAYNKLPNVTEVDPDQAGINSILDEYATNVASIVAALKTSAQTDVKAAITKAIKEGKLTSDWKSIGYAYTGTITDFGTMWDEYVTYLKNDVNVAWVTEGEDDHYLNEDNKLRKSLAYALDDILAAAKKDGNLATIPALDVPEGTYLNAPATGNDYLAVKAWIENNAAAITTDGCKYATNKDVKLENIQNWYIEAAKLEGNNITDVRAQKAAETYLDTVIEWEAPVSSDANMEALVKLIDTNYTGA